MKCSYYIFSLCTIIVGLTFLTWVQERTNEKILHKLSFENDQYADRVYHLTLSTELILKDYTKFVIRELEDKVIFYFPRGGCFQCLEELLIAVLSDYDFKDMVVLLMEDEGMAANLIKFNDSYGSKIDFFVVDPLFNIETDEIAFVKVEDDKIMGILIISPHDVNFYLGIISNSYKSK